MVCCGMAIVERIIFQDPRSAVDAISQISDPPRGQGEKFIRTFAATDNPSMRCWCGNEHLTDWGDGYRRCDACQTLVAEITPRQADPRVTDDAAALYGRDYWFAH